MLIKTCSCCISYKINLDRDNNFVRYNPDDFWLGKVNLKNTIHLKKIKKELIPMECHPKRWWNFFLSENEKKEIEPIFTEKCF